MPFPAIPALVAAGRAAAQGVARWGARRAALSATRIAQTRKAVKAARAAIASRASKIRNRVLGPPAPRNAWPDMRGSTRREAAIVAAQEGAKTAANFLTALDSAFPTFFHQVSVTVQGSPTCDLRRIWYLAVAACAGRVNASQLMSASTRNARGQAYTATWNVAEKTCSLTYSYSVSGLVANAFVDVQNPDTDTEALIGLGGAYRSRISHGVDQYTVGGGIKDINLNWTDGKSSKASKRVPGFTTPPTVLNGTVYSIRPYNGRADVSRERRTPDTDTRPVYRVRAIAPGDAVGQVQEYIIPADDGDFTLPDEGRVITTAETEDKRVQPPKPQVDGISRVHPLMSLVAPLINPGFSPVPTRLDLPEVQNLESQGLAAMSVSVTNPVKYPSGVTPAASVGSASGGAVAPQAPVPPAVLSQQAIDLAGVVGFAAAIAGSPVTGTP